MNIRELKEALAPLRDYLNGREHLEGMNTADLGDLLVRLNEAARTVLHRLEVVLDEEGVRTTPEFVRPGVYAEEVDLSVSIPRDPEAEVPVLFKRVTPEDFRGRIQKGLDKIRESFRQAEEDSEMIDRVLLAGMEHLAVDSVAPFYEESPRLTLTGFIEYAKIRFGLDDKGAVKVREVLAEAIHARLKRNANKEGETS